MILASGRHGARLCRQLQAYSGGTPLAPAPHDLLALANEMLPTLRASLGPDVEVSTTDDSRSVIGLVERGTIEQILLNLALNAREAHARHLRLHIGVARDAGDATAPERPVARIEVTDDGQGMAAEVAERVFDPFFTTKFPGRGLGLAVVHGGVRRHGGRIAVQSEPGRGTTFSIHLPLAD